MKNIHTAMVLLLSVISSNAATSFAKPHRPQHVWASQVTLHSQESPVASTTDLDDSFFAAISSGNDVDAIKMLQSNPSLALEKDQHGVSALMLAIYGRRPGLADQIADYRKGNLTIFEAAALGNKDKVKALLQQDPHLATMFGSDGFTALHLASYFGHLSSQQLLLDGGAPINETSQNNFHATPLQSAVAAGQYNAARFLLSKGANPNCKGEAGYTPLHEAAGAGQLELAQLLLYYGADPALKGDDGKTAIEIATERKRADLANLLKQEKP